MTAIAWAILIYAVIYDPTMKDATKGAKNLAYTLCTFGLIAMVILTIKDVFK